MSWSHPVTSRMTESWLCVHARSESIARQMSDEPKVCRNAFAYWMVLGCTTRHHRALPPWILAAYWLLSQGDLWECGMANRNEPSIVLVVEYLPLPFERWVWQQAQTRVSDGPAVEYAIAPPGARSEFKRFSSGRAMLETFRPSDLGRIPDAMLSMNKDHGVVGRHHLHRGGNAMRCAHRREVGDLAVVMEGLTSNRSPRAEMPNRRRDDQLRSSHGRPRVGRADQS